MRIELVNMCTDPKQDGAHSLCSSSPSYYHRPAIVCNIGLRRPQTQGSVTKMLSRPLRSVDCVPQNWCLRQVSPLLVINWDQALAQAFISMQIHSY